MAMNNIAVSHRLSLGNFREEFSRENMFFFWHIRLRNCRVGYAHHVGHSPTYIWFRLFRFKMR